MAIQKIGYIEQNRKRSSRKNKNSNAKKMHDLIVTLDSGCLCCLWATDAVKDSEL